ncbi:MAG: TonB-dependent receptor [Melioribacter sp.]|nr:TonB-dependent receptor [Melioribacter sp.]
MIESYRLFKIILICLILFSVLTNAQGTGTIRGKVFEKETGEPLIGANVVIKNTSLGAATDIEGRYVIRGIPAGTYTIHLLYLVHHLVLIEQIILAKKTFEQDGYLEAKTIAGETIIITAQAEGQLSAINQQLSSNTIANVVSKDRIKELPDVNAAESIGRLPGVSIERYGGEATKISIRGLEPKYNTITVNGVRLPSTSSYDRSVDLSLISSNMLDGIVLKKANTPDMDADALGGTVDLRLKEAPEGLKINATAQGGYNQLQNYYGNYNFNGSISNRFLNNKLGVILNFNLDNYDRSADKFSGSYTQTGSGENIIVKPNDITLRNENVRRGRSGASILLDYKLPFGKLTANSFYNRLHSKGLFRINDMNVEHNSHYYNLELREGNTSIFTGALGIQQDYGLVNLDMSLSRSSSITDNPGDLVFGFVQENGAFQTTKVEPGMDPHLIPSLQIIDTLKTGFKSAHKYSIKLKENETAYQLNIKVPFNFGKNINGYVKLGGKFRWLDKNNDQEQYGRDNIQYGGVGLNSVVEPVLRYLSKKYPNDWDWLKDSALARSNAVFPISRFLTNETPPRFLNGEYDLGFMVNEKLLRQFLEALQETSKENPQNWLYYSMGSIGYDYDGIERYQAAYIMSEISYKNLITFIPGIRFERDYSKYNGQRFKEAEQAGVQLPPVDFQDLENTRENKFWLPMVHLILNPVNWLKIRLARTETLTRPDYMQYAPITTIDRYNGYIRANNAALKPAKSTNYDASIQIYQNYIGFFTVSGFYKKIKDLIFQTGYQLQPGVAIPEGLNIPTSWLRDKDGRVVATPYMDTYLNNPYPAYYRGFELEWQTHFWYLPSILRGLIFNANYTRIFSKVDKQRFVVKRVVEGRPPRVQIKYIVSDTIRTGRMPYQPAHIFNFTLGYDYKDFSARLSFLYQTDKLTYLANYPGLDQSTGTYYRWDLTLQQKLNWGLQVFVNLNNLNKRADRSYRGNDETNAAYTEYYGFTMDVGIRYNF